MKFDFKADPMRLKETVAAAVPGRAWLIRSLE